MSRLGLALAGALACGGLALAWQVREPVTAGEWRTFRGSWSASGDRRTLATESGRLAAVIQMSGNVVVTAGDGLSRGFRGEAIGFDDGVSASAGRAVWTDERGDRIYSTIAGETIGTGRRVAGTITGGTGRYAGIMGEYRLTWQYVVLAEETAIQGRAVDLEGRFRVVGAVR